MLADPIYASLNIYYRPDSPAGSGIPAHLIRSYYTTVPD